MALQKGDTYECPKCGCECTVTKEPEEGKGGDEDLTCCCGNKMDKKD